MWVCVGIYIKADEPDICPFVSFSKRKKQKGKEYVNLSSPQQLTLTVGFPSHTLTECDEHL